jgi:hypothetical protein
LPITDTEENHRLLWRISETNETRRNSNQELSNVTANKPAVTVQGYNAVVQHYVPTFYPRTAPVFEAYVVLRPLSTWRKVG